MTTRMLRFPDQKTLGLALTAAASLLLPGISLAATTCAEVRTQNPAAQDGTYSLTLGSQQVAMYCHDMAGTPREYLTLPNTGSTTNYSSYGRGPNTSSIGLTTWFTKARLNPATLTLMLNDFTFSTSQGWARFGDYVYTNPLATAADCVGGWSETGRSNIDLTGTPLDIVPGQFQVSGYIPAGTATPTGSQIVNLTGGGYCGGIGAPDSLLQLSLRPTSEPPPAPELVHRYSFTTSGVDSVSGADASLLGGATVAQGEVVLNGAGAYVSLPIGGTVASLQSATFEAWVKWDSSSGQTWARIFDFNDGVWNKTLFLTPQNGRFDSGPATYTPRFAITTQAMSGEQQATSANGFPVGALTHVAVTMDSVARVNRLYINGVQVAQKQSTTLTPASLGLLPNHWLGRSLYPADPFFKGSFSEFRVYRTALSPSRIAAHTSAGPDQLEEAPTACNSGEPRLVLNGPSTLTLECGSSPYSDLGAQAFDGCGNPIPVHAYNTGTDSSGPGPNTSNEGSYSVSYAAWDAMGRTVSALRTVNVEDRTAPALQLIGPAFMTHTCGSQWVDPGVQAADACYGNVSAQVQRTGEVNGWVPGTYTVTYSLTDSGGNSAMPVTRTVQVANCPW